MRVLSSIIFCSLTSFAYASYCGQSGIPFSFEALANGQPILGCARPSCFGWNADGKRSADAAQFYKIGKQSDGFLRSTDTQGPIVKNATYFRPQFSICDRSYMSEQCATNQWVGGISPLPKIIPGSIFKVMCCSYTKLMESSDQGIAEIKGGETVVGGEIHGEDGRQHSFEYISNIQRSFNQKGEVIYSVTMKRFPCLPEPEITETSVESGTAEILIKNVEKVQKPEIQFSAPTLQIQPLPQRQASPTFNTMRFDIPSNMPAEGSLQQQQQQQYYQQQPQYFQQQVPQQQQQLNPLQQATAEPATEAPASSGCRKLANGQSVPCAKVYEDEPQQQQQQEQPIAIPQTSGSQQAVVYGPQQQQQQRQQLVAVPRTQPQQQYYQTNVFDPLGMFQQHYAAGSAAATYPATTQQQHPQMYQHSAIQAIPQPNHSYNPYWPFQGYYDYSQNPSAAYGVQTAQGFRSPNPLIAQGTKTAVPRPQPLPVPTIEEVEKAIPPAGRRMIYNVARTLLNLY